MSPLAEVIANQKLSRGQVALLILHSVYPRQVTVAEIRSIGAKLGRSDVKKWNMSQVLADMKPMCIRLEAGWVITEKGREQLVSSGLVRKSPLVVAQETLRGHASKIKHADVALFVGEVIGALEVNLLRSAVVMSWVGAVAILQGEIFSTKLLEFNTELVRRDPKARPVKVLDDFGYIKEYDFLQISAAISFIGKNVKQALEKALDLRNACGHPNSLQIAEHTVASHIEILILNVYSRC